MRRAYNFLYCVLWFIAGILYPTRCTGRENVPEGACILCATHSHAMDPLFVAVGLTRKVYLHFMCKIELMTVPIAGYWIKKIGSFGVDRGGNDIEGIRTAMRYLRKGEKLLIFPEGTRVSSDDAVDAKTGAVRLASRLQVPIVPVYIPREKKLFRKLHICVGKPYYVDAGLKDFAQASEALMEHILSLRLEAAQ